MADYPFHGYDNKRLLDQNEAYSAIKHEDRSDKYKQRVRDLASANGRSKVSDFIANTHPLWFIGGAPLTVITIIYLVFA